MKRGLLILCLVIVNVTVNAQKEINLLKKHEAKLLGFLLEDTIHNTNFTLSNAFNFGLNNQLFTNSNIIKRGKDVYVQPLGTGRLYKVAKLNGSIVLNRIDQTTHSGVNFFAQNFFIHDTLYQYGGIGFWQIRGILSFFSHQTNQWELIQANKAVPSFFDDQRDAMIHYDDARPDPKMYISNAYYYPNYPSSFETAAIDSCYEFDFNSRTWRTLGKIMPESKKIFDNNRIRTVEIHDKNLMIFQTQLMFYWLDFEKNQLGHLNARENDKLRQVWLAFYNNDKTKSQTMFQFNLGNELYYAKMSEDLDLQWTKTTIDLSILSKEDVIPIYDNQVSILHTIGLFVIQYKTYFLIVIILILVFISISAIVFRKKKVPKELTAILYQNFYNAINIVEKELIEALFETHAKGEELSTKAINKIIGVQQKDTLTQNKSRSDHFIKINQKFKMATQNTEPLIIKNRDKADKRQYNYDINELYITAIEKLLKE